MNIEVVANKDAEKAFIETIPEKIYRGDPHWMKPLSADLRSIFDAQQNPFFANGTLKRWIARDHEGRVGRIAAFYHHEKAYRSGCPTGGIGFFECSQNKELAFTLFRESLAWLKQQGMKAVEGPVNPGENDSNWGLLVNTHPAYSMNYNLPYYKAFFEAYGFTPAYDQYTNHYDLTHPLPQRFTRIAQRLEQQGRYTFRPFQQHKLDAFIRDMVTVYNKAWVHHENFTPIEYNYVRGTFLKMKSIIDSELIWFAYAEGKPVAFIVGVPDVNQIIRKLDGKLNFINKLRFLYYKHTGVIDRFRVLIMGVVPEYQNRGIESGLVTRVLASARRLKKYREAELSWVGSFNPKMMALYKASGAVFGKQHVTYRYEIK